MIRAASAALAAEPGVWVPSPKTARSNDSSQGGARNQFAPEPGPAGAGARNFTRFLTEGPNWPAEHYAQYGAEAVTRLAGLAISAQNDHPGGRGDSPARLIRGLRRGLPLKSYRGGGKGPST